MKYRFHLAGLKSVPVLQEYLKARDKRDKARLKSRPGDRFKAAGRWPVAKESVLRVTENSVEILNPRFAAVLRRADHYMLALSRKRWCRNVLAQ